MNKHAGADQQQEAALQQHLQIRFAIKNKAYMNFILHTQFTPATACSASSSIQVEAGGRGASMAGSARTEVQYYTQKKKYQ